MMIQLPSVETAAQAHLSTAVDTSVFTHHAHRHWFICVISNPQRYKSRYNLYREFRRHIIDELGANLITVEAAFGIRDHVITECQAHPGHRESNAPIIDHMGCKHNHSSEKAFDPTFTGTGNHGYEIVCRNNRHIHVQVRHKSELWIKESMMNIGIRHLPESCDYVTFADADIRFLRNDIVHEIVHGLQHYKVLQPWVNAIDLGPEGNIMGALHTSFAYKYLSGSPVFISPPPRHSTTARTATSASTRHQMKATAVGDHSGIVVELEKENGVLEFEMMESGKKLDRSFHPGYALSWRKSVLEQMGGALDICALGSGDMHMLYSLIGLAENSFVKGLSEGYKSGIRHWAEKAEEYVNRDLGYVNGVIQHGFHGFKASRGYGSRWSILTVEQFDPNLHLTKNLLGLWELRNGFPSLRDKFRAYFRSRNEDVLV